MRFLPSQHILEQVQRLVCEDGDVLAAVAFWGCGAVAQTRIASKRNGCVRVLCDLFSGSCNPNEIQILLNCSNVKVCTLHGMHAKVWENGDHVIVGSANASMNGLGFEAGGCNVEAAVQLRNRAKAKQVREWFDEIWNAALEVDQQVLAEANSVWDSRQNNAPRRIMNYHIGAHIFSGESDGVVEEEWRERNPDADESRISYYYFEPGTAVPQPGTVILDFTCQEIGGAFTFNAAWKIDGQPWSVSCGDGSLLVVDLRRVDDPRFPIRRHDVAKMIKCSVKDNCWIWDDSGWSLYKNFADFFYGTRARCRKREDQCEDCPFRQEREV